MGLIEEVSLLLAPGMDGRHGVLTVFDWVHAENEIAHEHEMTHDIADPLTLKSLELPEEGRLWIRYEVARP